jgi:hypothetical protein
MTPGWEIVVAIDVSPDWSPGDSASYFFIIIVIRHETTAAARRALPLIVRTLFNDAITVAVWTGFSFHVCLPVGIFDEHARVVIEHWQAMTNRFFNPRLSAK